MPVNRNTAAASSILGDAGDVARDSLRPGDDPGDGVRPLRGSDAFLDWVCAHQTDALIALIEARLEESNDDLEGLGEADSDEAEAERFFVPPDHYRLLH
jgi:hypothetical protein